MVGEAVASESMALAQKWLEIILMLLRFMHEHGSKAAREGNNHIKYGKINALDYKRMMKNGVKFTPITIPKECLKEVSQIAARLGGGFSMPMYDDKSSPNVVINVPDYALAAVSKAVELVTQKRLAESPDTLKVHKGNELIEKEKADIVNDALNYYDIPAYRFVNGDGSQMNIISPEYEDSYKNAVARADEIYNDINKNIVMEKFIPTVPLNEIDYELTELDGNTAEYLTAEFGNNIEILQDGEQLAAKFSRDISDNVHKALSEQDKQLEEYDLDNDIAVVDNTITINKSLIANETDNAYLTRVPNTKGSSYIWLNKNDVEPITDKKGNIVTLKSTIDYSKSYTICDKNGNETGFKGGDELAELYNTKNVLGNKNTNISHHFRDNLERIEIYNGMNNSLMSIGIENADTVRSVLAANGIKGAAAEKMLNKINEKLSPYQREVFAYNANREFSFSAQRQSGLDNLIKQAAAAKLAASAEYAGSAGKFSTEPTVYIYNKENNRYTLIDEKSANAAESIAALGLNGLKSSAVMTAVNKQLNFSLEEIKGELHTFPDNMALDNMKYFIDGENAYLLKMSTDDKNAVIDYAALGKASDINELEKVLTDKNKFGIDKAAAANCMSYIASHAALSAFIKQPKENVEVIDNVKVTYKNLSSDFISLSANGNTMNIAKSLINSEDIANKLNISTKTADKLANGLKAMVKDNTIDKSGAKLENIKQRIKNAVDKSREKKVEIKEYRTTNTIMDEKGKASETSSFGRNERSI